MLMLVRLAMLCIALAGCGPAVEIDEDSGDASDSGGTMGTTTASSTTASTTVATSTTGTTATTTASTTGEPPSCASDWVTGVQSYCAQTVTCDPEQGPFEDCVNAWLLDLGEFPPECQVAWCDALTCYGVLPCEATEEQLAACDELFYAADSCGRGECLVGVGPDGACDYICGEQRLSCSVEACTCYEGDIATTSCPADGICGDPDAIAAYAAACCGW